jgi:hypothetical protein
MPSLDTKDFDLIFEFERDFARTLRSMLADVFEVDAEIGDTYLRSLASAPLYERLIALHQSPIDVASMLTGTPISSAMYERYENVLRQNARSRPRDLRFPDVFSSVPQETVESILRLFGYEKLEHDDDRLWQLSAPDPIAENRPLRVSTPQPEYLVATGGRFYGVSSVIDLIAQLSLGRISPEGALLIIKALSG